MRIRTLVAITLTMFAVPAVGAELPAAPAPREATSLAILYKLRNVAAVDAAQALATHVEAQKLAARVAFDAVSNNVYVSASPSVQRQLGEVIAALDKAPQQVFMAVTVIQVPRGFAEECGLTGDSPAWALTAREQQMFTALLRRAKERGELDVLSRPQVQVADNQTGFVQVGQQVPFLVPSRDGTEVKTEVKHVQAGFTLRVTPRVTPDGGLLIRSEAQLTEVKGTRKAAVATAVPGALLPTAQVVTMPNFHTQSVQTTAELKDGQTVILACRDRGAGSLTASVRAQCGDRFETLVILTPHIVRP